jgi:hypothetical protein
VGVHGESMQELKDQDLQLSLYVYVIEHSLCLCSTK